MDKHYLAEEADTRHLSEEYALRTLEESGYDFDTDELEPTDAPNIW